MNTFDDLLNVSSEVLKQTSRDIEIYDPKAKDGNNGVYKAVVRFVPWYKDQNASLIKKYTCYLINPADETGKYIDCPSTEKKPSPLLKMWLDHRNDESPRGKAIKERFSRKPSCYAPVQILKDPQRPELEGKIMIMKFGKKILDKIEAEMNGDDLVSDGATSNSTVPWHLLQGRRFKLHMKQDGKWSNPDMSTFEAGPYPFINVNGENIDLTSAGAEEKTKVVEFLKENTPDLDKYRFVEWTDETHEYVNKVIRNTLNPVGDVEDDIRTNNNASRNRANSRTIDDILDDSTPASDNSEKPVDINSIESSGDDWDDL